MHIAVITNAYPPDARGGAGMVAADLVHLWQQSGHEVRVWTHAATWLTKNPFFRLLSHLIHDRGTFFGMDEVLAWQPDVVVTHNLTGIGWNTGAYVQAHGLAWMHVLHDVQLFEPSGQLQTDHVSYWQLFWVFWRKRIFGEPDLVLSPTAWLLRAHERRGYVFSQTAVLANPAPAVAVVLSPTKKTTWLYVGRLSRDKGADFLERLARMYPAESFICIGDGPLRASLACLPNVRCLGVKSRPDIQEALASAHGLLMPSRLQENQPTVILEAFAQGVPVIAATGGGIPETVGMGGVIASFQTEEWYAAMTELKAHPDDWSQKAQEQARIFARTRIQQAWEACFTAVLQ